MKRRQETIDELMARLNADPDWVRRRDERERLRQAKGDKLRKAEQPIVRDLVAVGLDVASVYDLVNAGRGRYEAAIPVLLKHLAGSYPNRIREGIARSLGRRWARDLAWEPVLEAYLKEPNKPNRAPPDEIGAPSGPKEGMAVALSQMARPDDLDQVIRLISDPANGPSRVFFVENLSRSKSQRAFETLGRLSKDAEIAPEIEFRLKNKLRRQAKKDRARSATRQ